MIVKKITQEYPLIIPPPRSPRSPGVHLSSIIRSIATEVGLLRPEWAEEVSLVDVRSITDPEAILRINIGLAWEEHYIPLVQDVVDHPEEIQVDGVYMSLDGESVSLIKHEDPCEKCNHYTRVVHEVKATYKSLKTVGDLSREWMWLAQMRGYCKALDTTVARLHVLFLCGDYSYPIKPLREVYEVQFTEEEIQVNWNDLLAYRDMKLGEK